MKKLTLFTILSIFLCVTSCEKDAVLVKGCTDQTATNYNAEAEKDDSSCIYYSDLIIGTWNGETVMISLEKTEEMIQMMIFINGLMTPEEFENEFGVTKPTTDEEWLDFTQNTLMVGETENITGETIVFTETTMSKSDEGNVISFNYAFTSHDRFTVDGAENDLNIDYFDIVTCTETDLVLTTTQYNEEEGLNATITVTCTR
jgi:hypothetical protein